MNKLIYVLVGGALLLNSCSDFLDVTPVATETEESFFTSAENAEIAVNACYNIMGLTEGPGPDGQWLNHNYEFFFGDCLSDDSEKGSTETDLADVQNIIEWRATSGNGILETIWIKCYDGIYRANNVIKQLEGSSFDQDLKDRLKGEALFVRGYFYFYLVKVFGGVPLFTEPVTPSQFGNVTRGSYHETFERVITDFKDAAALLPTKSVMGVANVGRANQGVARTFLARALMYQIGMDAQSTAQWSDVYAQTSAIIESGDYTLVGNYATIHEMEGENNDESIFELQMEVGTTESAPGNTGTNFNQFQGNRMDWGWGFNNPTQDLFDAYEENDPRLTATLYGASINGGVVHGVKRDFDANQQMTPFLNRKAALEPSYRPSLSKSSPFNHRLARYAEVLLMHAEAAYHIGNEAVARQYLELIRDRARQSTFAKGSVEGSLDYTATGYTKHLPEVTSSGNDLLLAIYQERRVELAMESLRYWDLVRTGSYLDMLGNKKINFKKSDNVTDRYKDVVDLKANCEAKCIDGPNGHKIPLLPIPLYEVQNFGLSQNKGYN